MRRCTGRFDTRHPRAPRQAADDGFERLYFERPALGTDLITVHKDNSQYRDKVAFSGRILSDVVCLT